MHSGIPVVRGREDMKHNGGMYSKGRKLEELCNSNVQYSSNATLVQLTQLLGPLRSANWYFLFTGSVACSALR